MGETEKKSNNQDNRSKPIYKDPKAGMIIEIPDSKTIIVNLGSKNSRIKRGDEIIIYEEGPEIKLDDNIIGRYDFDKETIQVVRVDDNISVCKKIIRYTKPAPMTSMATLMGGKEVQEEIDLNVEVSDVKNWVIKDPKIKINDPVKFITD